MEGQSGGAGYISRIVGLEMVAKSDRAPHPDNWQTHPQSQKDALTGILEEVGITDVILGYRSQVYNPGKVTIIDGHLRDEVAPQDWPILILDITDDEARYILATHDPVANMSVAIPDRAAVLFNSIRTSNAGVGNMLAALRGGNARLLETMKSIQRKPGALGGTMEEQLQSAPAGFSMFPEPEELEVAPTFFDATRLGGAVESGATHKQAYLIYITFSDIETFYDALRLLSNGARDERREGMTMASLVGDDLLPVWHELLGASGDEED